MNLFHQAQVHHRNKAGGEPVSSGLGPPRTPLSPTPYLPYPPLSPTPVCTDFIIIITIIKNNHIQMRNSRFLTISSPCRKLSPSSQEAWAQSCANHMQHIQRFSRATCHVTCHVVPKDSSAIKFDRVEIAFILALSYWLNH